MWALRALSILYRFTAENLDTRWYWLVILGIMDRLSKAYFAFAVCLCTLNVNGKLALNRITENIVVWMLTSMLTIVIHDF